MELTEIGNLRLMNQQIGGGKIKTAGKLVGWMGAMQAQDYAMAKWAIGMRVPGSTDKYIETAIDKGEILRTHLLRPTWHFVSASDIHWMLALTAPKIKAAMSSRQKQLGLTQAIFTETITIMENALSGGKHLTREALITELKQAKIAVDENRASHLLARAELDGVLCSGATQKGKYTYALLEERVPKTLTLTKEESLARLAQIYFSSRGPATIQDFVWWSGLTLTACRQALEMVKAGFISETIDSKNYWFPNSQASASLDEERVHLLPAYDEYTICYADRSAVVPSGEKARLISENGIFRPILVVKGQVQGIWKRTIKKEQVLLEIDFFKAPDKKTIESIEKAVMEYGEFVDKKPEMSFKK
jgi:hypothetical protein